MLFPGQGNIDRTAFQRIARTYQRLRQEGVPADRIRLTLNQQVKALITAGTLSSYAGGKVVERVIDAAGRISKAIGKGSFLNTPSKKTSKRLRGNIEPVQPSAKKIMLERDPRTGRRHGRDEDEPMAPAPTDPPNQLAIAAPGGKGRRGNGETPISPYDFVQIGLPKVATTKLPYRRIESQTSLSTSGTTPVNYAVRTNSIFDILGNSAYSPDSVAVGETAPTGIAETPKWRAFFTDKYNYYTVLGCDYSISFRLRHAANIGGFPTIAAPNHCNDFDVFMYKAGFQRPPLQSSGTIVKKDWKLLHTGVEYKLLPGPKRISDATVAGASAANQYECDFQWRTFKGWCGIDTFKHEVEEDELKQTWHKNNEIPPIPEQLVFHIQPNEFNNVNLNDYSLDVIIETTYLVQFKDLRAQYQFPTSLTEFGAIPAGLSGIQGQP